MDLQHFNLAGKTALVTGGGTGIGYYMTRGLLKSGAKVLIAARREEVLKAAAERLTKETGNDNISHYFVDLNDTQSITDLISYASESLGGIDVLVGNAGLDVTEPVDAIKTESLDRLFKVNTYANIELLKGVATHMKAKKWGRIIFVTSASAQVGGYEENIGGYAASKGALDAFTRWAAAELGHEGITVNSIVPGPFKTEIIDIYANQMKEVGMEDAEIKAFLDKQASITALGRWGRPEEIEGLIQFVASDASSFMTGSNLIYDGGMSMMLHPRPLSENKGS